MTLISTVGVCLGEMFCRQAEVPGIRGRRRLPSVRSHAHAGTWFEPLLFSKKSVYLWGITHGYGFFHDEESESHPTRMVRWQ